MTLVIPRVWISGEKEATDDRWLKKNNITHILNCAVEVDYFPPENVKYAKIFLDDSLEQDISKSVNLAADHIYACLYEGGNVLVHCAAGISRSVSMVIAYLIKYHDMDYKNAYDTVSKKRKIAYPNKSFQTQLKKFQTKIHK